MGNIHTGMMSCARLWFVVILVALWPRVASAQGGPPLMTDDPDTPGPNHWEINLAMLLETSRLERRIDTPRLDLNFGLGRRIQLKFEVPWVSVRDEDNKIQSGTGNAVAGVKWRFVGQEGTRIAWSIYPQLEFNTAHGSVVKGIVEDGRQFLLPTELTVEFVHAEIDKQLARGRLAAYAPLVEASGRRIDRGQRDQTNGTARRASCRGNSARGRRVLREHWSEAEAHSPNHPVAGGRPNRPQPAERGAACVPLSWSPIQSSGPIRVQACQSSQHGCKNQPTRTYPFSCKFTSVVIAQRSIWTSGLTCFESIFLPISP